MRRLPKIHPSRARSAAEAAARRNRLLRCSACAARIRFVTPRRYTAWRKCCLPAAFDPALEDPEHVCKYAARPRRDRPRRRRCSASAISLLSRAPGRSGTLAGRRTRPTAGRNPARAAAGCGSLTDNSRDSLRVCASVLAKKRKPRRLSAGVSLWRKLVA